MDSLGRGSTICRATARVVLRSEVKIVDVWIVTSEEQKSRHGSWTRSGRPSGSCLFSVWSKWSPLSRRVACVQYGVGQSCLSHCAALIEWDPEFEKRDQLGNYWSVLVHVAGMASSPFVCVTNVFQLHVLLPFYVCLVCVCSVCLVWPKVLGAYPCSPGLPEACPVSTSFPFHLFWKTNKQTNKAREMTWFSFRFFMKCESYLISPLKAVLPWMISPIDAMKPRFCVGLKRVFTRESVQTLSLMSVYWVSVLCPSLCEELVSWLDSLVDDQHLSQPLLLTSHCNPHPLVLYTKVVWRYLDI